MHIFFPESRLGSLCLVVLSCSVMSDFLPPMDCCSPPESMGFSKQEFWSELPCPPPGDLPNPRIEPRSPTLQADSLPSDPQGSPRRLDWVAYPFFRGSSWPRNQTSVSCLAGGFFPSWAVTTPAPVHLLSLVTWLLSDPERKDDFPYLDYSYYSSLEWWTPFLLSPFLTSML